MRKGLAIAAAAVALLATPALAQRPDARTAVVAFSTDAQTLDPPANNSRDTQNIADHIWGSLYEIADDGGLSPYLAQSTTENADGTEIDFKLAPGLTCHDGSPLNPPSAPTPATPPVRAQTLPTGSETGTTSLDRDSRRRGETTGHIARASTGSGTRA